MPSTSIVIPVYNNWQGCHQLLLDLYKQCSLIEEVIVVDDASTESSVQKGLGWWKSQNLLPIEVISNKKNLGFLKSSNVGMKSAVEDIVCLISTDVRIHGDIINHLKNIFSFKEYSLVGGRLLDWDTGWNTFAGKTFSYLEGWILASSKKGWEELGYFDEIFAPNDYEDIDLTTKAVNLDYKIKVFPEGQVSHVGAQSIGYSEERSSLTERNRKKFEEKWMK